MDGYSEVAIEPDISLTFSIWRDFAPPRPLALSETEGERALDAEAGLREEVYRWRLREDALAGISDDSVRKRLQECLRRLDGSQPLNERHPGRLGEFVDIAEQAIEDGSVDLATSQSALGGDDADVAINVLLSLTWRLKWILACFADRPGISVLVR